MDQIVDEMGHIYNSHADHLDISMKRLNTALESVVKGSSSLVLTTVVEKRKVPKVVTLVLIPGAVEKQSNGLAIGSSYGEPSNNGHNSMPRVGCWGARQTRFAIFSLVKDQQRVRFTEMVRMHNLQNIPNRDWALGGNDDLPKWRNVRDDRRIEENREINMRKPQDPRDKGNLDRRVRDMVHRVINKANNPWKCMGY
ncbi:hypothetical protein ACH5RR_013107 [Cinchona calisaya]|uniref:Uncharacterized protein n=1 Tax=Cinchona calisaya TaxID=153742 RepID=A0ABD2ZZ39_9GENT